MLRPAIPRATTLLAAFCLCSISAIAQESQRLPPELVFLRDVAPSIAQDIRYASPFNFTGRKVPGYESAECILTRETALALKRVQAGLERRGLSLKVYDCYRPRRAVAHFSRWVQRPARAGEPDNMAYMPATPRQKLMQLGYIAAVSRHSRGDTVDLTLIELPGASPKQPDPSTLYGPCTGPVEERAPDNSVDMGTGYDCFDPKSKTASPTITEAQKKWRETLVAAMVRGGFHNYHREWWHFTYGPGDGPSYDFPISAKLR